MRAVLTYHSICEADDVLSTRPALFREQMSALQRSGYQVVGLEELVRRGAGSRPVVALTFDDAFLDFAENAAPVLREFGYPATVFVVSEFAGKTNDWPGQVPGFGGRPLMSWEQLAKIANAGFQIGGHCRTHAHLARMDTRGIASEIRGGLDEIERQTGSRPTSFAYPYGECPPAAHDVVTGEGLLGVTTEFAIVSAVPDLATIPRLDAYYFRDPSRLEGLFESSTMRWIALRRALRAVRRRMPL